MRLCVFSFAQANFCGNCRDFFGSLDHNAFPGEFGMSKNEVVQYSTYGILLSSNDNNDDVVTFYIFIEFLHFLTVPEVIICCLTRLSLFVSTLFSQSSLLIGNYIEL